MCVRALALTCTFKVMVKLQFAYFEKLSSVLDHTLFLVGLIEFPALSLSFSLSRIPRPGPSGVDQTSRDSKWSQSTQMGLT